MKNRRKWRPDGSQEGFGAQNGEKSVASFFKFAFWAPIWAVLGAAQGPQGSPWGAPGPTKGVQNTPKRYKVGPGSSKMTSACEFHHRA